MKFTKMCCALALASCAPAFAGTDFDRLQTLSQSEFGKLAADFTAAASYKAVAPAEPLGVTGFDIGVEMTATRLHSADVWKKAGADESVLPMPKVHVHKGLPFKFDVGASLAMVPGSDIKLMGAEVRYSILEGGVTMPALSVRGAATRLVGVDELDLNTRSVELTMSKGFVMFTPYIGVGKVWGNVDPNVGNLTKVSATGNKIFAGLNANFGLANLAAEMDRTGDTESYSVKLGFRF